MSVSSQCPEWLSASLCAPQWRYPHDLMIFAHALTYGSILDQQKKRLPVCHTPRVSDDISIACGATLGTNADHVSGSYHITPAELRIETADLGNRGAGLCGDMRECISLADTIGLEGVVPCLGVARSVLA